MYRPECGFRLSDDVQSYGLDCSKTGLALAGVPLLYQGNAGFSARRPEEILWLLSSAYQRQPKVGAIEAGLNANGQAQQLCGSGCGFHWNHLQASKDR